MTQIPLPFAASESFAAADFLPDASNAAARAFLAQPEAWPGGRLALWGAPGVGKSHLLHATAAARGWPVWHGAALRGWPALPAAPGLALDEAAAAGETALFHLVNLCAEEGRRLLLAARTPPARWPVALPDLASRLRATTAVELGVPGDALLAALLEKHFADRQLRTEPAFRAWLIARLPREAAAVADAVRRLDQAALAGGRPVTRALARQVLPALADDDSMAKQPDASPPLPGLG